MKPDRRPAPAAESMPQLPIRVFLAEDSAIIRQRLTESIEDPGRVEVIGYAEAEAQAIDALDHLDCDVLLLDLQLRDGNGLGVLKALRGQQGRRPTVVVMTNYAFPHYRDKSLALGADYFFDKAREYGRVGELLQAMAAQRDGDAAD